MFFRRGIDVRFRLVENTWLSRIRNDFHRLDHGHAAPDFYDRPQAGLPRRFFERAPGVLFDVKRFSQFP